MLEKTRAAAAKAKEHLEAAKRLVGPRWLPVRRDYEQAYAHLTLALEEVSVAGVRLLTESGILSWEESPPWLTWTESDLTRRATHEELMRLGLTMAALSAELFSAAPSRFRRQIRNGTPSKEILATSTNILLESLPHLLSDPALLDQLSNGVRLRFEASYSSPRKGAGRTPDKADYKRLLSVVDPLVRRLNRKWPSDRQVEDFVSLIRPALPQIVEQFGLKQGDLSDRLRAATGGKWPPKSPN